MSATGKGERFLDEAPAEDFRDAVNDNAQQWPPGRVKGKGYVAPGSEDEARFVFEAAATAPRAHAKASRFPSRGAFVLPKASYTEAVRPHRLAAMTECVQVSTATETRDQAVALAAGAVEQRLAAGAQVVGPVVSVFWHLGKQGTGEEWQLLLKTTKGRYPQLESYLLDNHPWDNPEVCAVPITLAADHCIEWVQKSVEPS